MADEPQIYTTRYGVPILDFNSTLEPYLVGPTDESKQFFIDQGEHYCIRATCDGCPIKEGCESVQEPVMMMFNDHLKKPRPQPHPRRGVGYEQRSFYPLFWDDALTDAELIEAGIPAYHIMGLRDEENFTGLLDPIPYRPEKNPLRVLKQQLRWYGTPEEYAEHPISKITKLLPPYIPHEMKVVSFDFSSIEPLTNTIVTREPEWMKVFYGYPKEALREVAMDSFPKDMSCLIQIDQADLTVQDQFCQPKTTHYVCHLMDELQKTSFEKQCGKCANKESCRVLHGINLTAKDSWHDINLKYLYSDMVPQWSTGNKDNDDAVFKHYRGITKIVGLAITYGGSAWTVSKNMGETPDQAQVRIDGFLGGLPVFRSYMNNAKQRVLQTGRVYSLFGRMRDIHEDSHPNTGDWKMDRKRQGYAQRTALNHPIQGSAGDILKIVTIRVNQHIRNEKLSPLAGYSLPKQIDVYNPPRTLLNIFLSVHDETDYLMWWADRDKIISKVYEISQLADVLKGFGVDFTLELDIEYDKTSTWTGKIKYPAARAYGTRYVEGLRSRKDLPREEVGSADSRGATEIIVLELSSTPRKFLDNLSSEVDAYNVSYSGVRLPLVLRDKNTNQSWDFDRLVAVSMLQERGIPYVLEKR